MIYLDNAATTPLDPEVFEAMKPFMLHDFGNPSSTHSHGRKTRAALEAARQQIAALLNAEPGEIVFTSGGTEADNALLRGAIQVHGVQHVITSPLEHHAVSHTLEVLAKQGWFKLHHVTLDEKGHINFDDLETLLKENPLAVVSLMHANNEIGNLLDIERVGDLCNYYNAWFHSDTVQTVGHLRHDLSRLKVDGITAGAHKFHGPKGAGFMFVRKKKRIEPFIHGGAQERNMRGGTENVYGVIGMAKALELAYRDMDVHARHIRGLKSRMIAQLREAIPGISFHGDSEDLKRSLYTILNVCLPECDERDQLLFNLDQQGISASGGSACSSNTPGTSHVLKALYPSCKGASVRFSFSRFNTTEDVDQAVRALEQLCCIPA